MIFMAKGKTKNIGVDVKTPEKTCNDKNCPFHGSLSVRGQIINGVLKTKKMDGTVVVKKDNFHYVPKYQRYEKRRSHYSAHLPPCIDVEEGDKVKIMECRSLSKSVSFVVVENRGEE